MLADSVGLALLIVLDTLEPAERLAFVLHDVFGMTFDEIAPIVDRSPVAARQLASRARRRVQSTAPSSDRDCDSSDASSMRSWPPSARRQLRGVWSLCSIPISCCEPMAVRWPARHESCEAPQAVAGQAEAFSFSKLGLSDRDRPGEWQCRPPGATSRRSTLLRDRLHDRQRKDRRDEHPRGPGSTQQARSLSDQSDAERLSDMTGGGNDGEQVDSADPPLAVYCLYGDRHRQLRRHGTGRWDASALGDVLAAAPARLASVHRSVLVRAAVCHQVAQRRRTGEAVVE